MENAGNKDSNTITKKQTEENPRSQHPIQFQAKKKKSDTSKVVMS